MRPSSPARRSATTSFSGATFWSDIIPAIADHCWLAGQAVFGGSASLGEGSFVGLGAIVAHEVEIGAKSFLGAGVLVTKCADAKSVFVAAGTERFRLDSDRFFRITRCAKIPQIAAINTLVIPSAVSAVGA